MGFNHTENTGVLALSAFSLKLMSNMLIQIPLAAVKIFIHSFIEEIFTAYIHSTLPIDAAFHWLALTTV